MRRVAALYDIHGNLPALEAVVADVRKAGVDQIVIGGDVVPGPMPTETIACLRGLDIPLQCIHGNGEREVLNALAGRALTTVPAAFQWMIAWSAQQLSADDQQWMAAWPATRRLALDGLGDALFCHATPRNDVEIFTRLTPDEKLRPLFDPIGAPLAVCGHTHMQHDRMVGATRVVNAGSVGMPFGPPGAYWLLLGPGIELKRTDYDLTSAAARIRASSYPEAEQFAATSVLQPPSEQQILDMFGKAELTPEPPLMPTYAVGDVHARLKPLEDLLAQLEGASAEGDTIVFLGDYIDRGPESRQCIEAILQFRDRAAAEVVGIRGNHEDWLLKTMRDQTRHSWLLGMNGFDTVRSYSPEAEATLREAVEDAGLRLYVGRCKLPYDQFFDEMPETHRHFFETLSIVFENDDGLFAHGGVDPEVPFDRQSSEAYIWGGGTFPDGYTGAKPIVYGHWNNARFDEGGWPHPLILGETIGVDTIAHGVLTAIRLPDRQVFQSARYRP